MRMRRKKHGAERIAACSALLIEHPELLMADPTAAFPEKKPLALEIGCGKGAFACGTAAANPDVNLIAMERVADVACLALEKATECADTRPDNLRFIIGNAENLPEWLPAHSLDTIYLNFSDPWPKSGYKKRRLTHRGFLEKYRELLVPGGMLKFKTDNHDLFFFSLEEFEACGLEIVWKTEDLHASEMAATNVMTEYEANFTAKGMPIYSAHVRFPA